jgi:hypothetical protein
MMIARSSRCVGLVPFGHTGRFCSHRFAEDHWSPVAARTFGFTERNCVLSLEIAMNGAKRPATPNEMAS